MSYIEVKLNKCTVFLKPEEINKMLLKDTELFAEVLKRSKYILRHQKQKQAERQKYEREKGL